MNIFYYLLALSAGFLHSFEPDHLAAVSSIVSTQKDIKPSIKTGIFWGLGHSLMIVIFSVFIILLKFKFSTDVFTIFDFFVGILLVFLGIYVLYKLVKYRKYSNDHHFDDHLIKHSHQKSFSIGILHGLAGSGVLIVGVISSAKSSLVGIIYLALFSVGLICGMSCASFIMGNLVSKKFFIKYKINTLFIITTALFCIIYGIYMAYEQIHTFYL